MARKPKTAPAPDKPNALALEMMVLRSLDSIKRWEDNYRRGNIEAIAASIERFGFNGALRVWHDTVMAGNHAHAALEKLRADGVAAPMGVIDQGGDWLIPCIDISHLSETEAKAFATADNRIQELGDVDNERLLAILSEVAEVDVTMLNIAGFESDDLDDLRRLLDPDQSEPGKKKQVSFEAGEEPETDTTCPKCGHRFKHEDKD